MDKQGFYAMLRNLELNKKQIEASMAIAERFEDYIKESGSLPSAETAWEFSRLLIQERNNTYENYIALIRYCRFIKNDAMFVAMLELVDGGEVGENLYRMVEEKFGAELRNEIFSGIGVAAYGLPTPDKAATLHPVLERLQAKVGAQACRDFLSSSLRDLPDRYFRDEKKNYRKTQDMDEYLKKRHQSFVKHLKKCQRQGQLFFAQEITCEVVAFVQANPEIGGGRREGNIIYETKIPYMAKQYLAESDATLKRYYACHCPWAREAVKRGDVRLFEDLCSCSGGFHKKPFEVIFGQNLKVDVLESVLKGDERCRFAIHLPEGALVHNE